MGQRSAAAFLNITAEDLAEDKNSAGFDCMDATAYEKVENQIEAALQIYFGVRKALYNNWRTNRDLNR